MKAYGDAAQSGEATRVGEVGSTVWIGTAQLLGGTMATHVQIQEYVAAHHGFTPKTCWIANVKEIAGLEVRRAWNRRGKTRKVPCPPDKIEPIMSAFRHFKMI